MVECPECGQAVRGKKCRCGWVVPLAQSVDGVRQSDPMYGCCDWIGDGQCHYPGVFRHGNGKWFCRQHDACTDALSGAQIVEQSHRDIPNPDYSPEANRARSLNSTQRFAAEYSALRTPRKAA